MSLKAIVFFALITVTIAERPRVGLRVPFLPQIVGGDEAPKGAYPFIVSLQWGMGSDTSHFCAGIILKNQWILTAGHCPQALPPVGKFIIKAGKHNLKRPEDSEQTVEVEEIFVHEQYKGGVGPYDIALLKLKNPLTLTKEVQAIGLPQAGSEPNGDAILCGWGSIGSTMPDKLQHVELPVIDLELCDNSVKRLTGSSPVHETNVCTGPLSGGTSACSGDSGGPLTQIQNGKLTCIGIVSWGIIPCGTVGAPSVYTGVSKHTKWIEEKMSNN